MEIINFNNPRDLFLVVIISLLLIAISLSIGYIFSLIPEVSEKIING